MQENHSVDFLMQRLDSLSGELLELRQEIKLTFQLADIDPRMTLTRTRRVLEYVVNEVYRRHFNEDPGTRPLDNLLQRLIKEHVLPPKVGAYASGIRQMGNLGTHGKGDEILPSDAQHSIDQLVVILLWYFEQERPESLSGSTASSKAVEAPASPQPPPSGHADQSPSQPTLNVDDQAGERHESAKTPDPPRRQKRWWQSRLPLLAGGALSATVAIAATVWLISRPDPKVLEDAYNRGLMYQNGNGVPKDSAEAVRSYRKAADGGVAKAQYALGVMYQQGWGVGQDPAEAAQWFRKAADQGNALAQNDLGVLYQYGRGVMQDATVAVQWYRKAADQGDALAQRNLGTMYFRGLGTGQDYAQAATWYQKAADHGDMEAKYWLGAMYLKGTGVQKNADKAFVLVSTAANGGLAVAQNDLGVMYENGWGVGKDLNAALTWYQTAANRGSAPARQNFARLNAALANARKQAEMQQQALVKRQESERQWQADEGRRQQQAAEARRQLQADDARRQQQAAEVRRQQQGAEVRRQQQADEARRQQPNDLVNNILRGLNQLNR